MTEWQPLSQRHRGEPVDEALHEGIPPWLRGSIVEWIRRELLGGPAGTYDREILTAVDRNVRLGLDWNDRGSHGMGVFYATKSLAVILEREDDRTLDIADYLLSRMNPLMRPSRAEELRVILAEGGSAWTVTPSNDGLVRRVSEGVEAAVTRAVEGATRPGAHLAQAWVKTYGKSPSPGEAYREAVRAVEAAAAPIVIPNDPVPTLGKIIAVLKSSPAKWRFELTPSPPLDAVAALVTTLELLWKSQFDRHGTADESVPLNVSQGEAEAAVHLAIALTHWFASGSVGRA